MREVQSGRESFLVEEGDQLIGRIEYLFFLLLAMGVFVHRGKRIDLGDITQTALLAIEGERDDISGLGQTKAALDLTPKLSDEKKRYYMAEGAGHYGIFNGSRWREKIAPVVEEFVAAHG